jgi:VanZ family protein
VIARFGPPLAVMAVIWFLSAQPDLHSGLDTTLDLILRKLAHMAVFGLLLLAWWRAIGPLPAVVITLAYAAVDEWHQTWVEGRVGAFSDWAIDAAGAGVAAALVIVWQRRAGRAATAAPPASSRAR